MKMPIPNISHDRPMDESRRRIAAGVLSALGGALLLKGCSKDEQATASLIGPDDLDSVAAALSGSSAVRWFDSAAEIMAASGTPFELCHCSRCRKASECVADRELSAKQCFK